MLNHSHGGSMTGCLILPMTSGWGLGQLDYSIATPAPHCMSLGPFPCPSQLPQTVSNLAHSPAPPFPPACPRT
ncbi:unnamed protein product [Gadus morhua 'NCC']